MGERVSVPRMPCQFSPMPVPCIRPLMEAGVLTRQGAVLQILLLHRFAGRGGATWMSYPVDRMAEELGIKKRAVSDAVNRLVVKGVLRTVVMGYKGKASVYELIADGFPSKVRLPDVPNDPKVRLPDVKGTTGSHQRYDPESYPTRTNKELVKTAPEGPALGGPAPEAGDAAPHATRNPPNTVTVEEWQRMRGTGVL